MLSFIGSYVGMVLALTCACVPFLYMSAMLIEFIDIIDIIYG